MDIEPHGPRKIAPKNQVSIPVELLDAVGLQVGDSVWVAVNPDRPGSLVLLTRATMIEVFQAGWDRTRPEVQ